MPGSSGGQPVKPTRLPSLGRSSAGKNLPTMDHERKLRSIIGLCDDTTTAGSAMGEAATPDPTENKPRMNSQLVAGRQAKSSGNNAARPPQPRNSTGVATSTRVNSRTGRRLDSELESVEEAPDR